MLESFRAVIACWPSIGDFASDIGVSDNTAKQMRTRNSIPDAYWARAISGAEQRKLRGITLKLFASLAEQKRRAA